MGKFVDIRGAIEANTIYNGTTLVACDATVTLPEVTPTTGDVNGVMGTASIPLAGSIEDMEMTITKVGVDKGIATLCTPGKHSIEIRWVQDVVKSDGTVSQEGCKAFMTAIPKTFMPGASLEIGSPSENDLTFEVIRYQLYVNGSEVFLVDRFAKTLKFNGTSYASFDSYL